TAKDKNKDQSYFFMDFKTSPTKTNNVSSRGLYENPDKSIG
ncbi:unnamed protein product, partial [marine sediment metagenome]